MLQDQVLESAKKYYGPDYPSTLQIMDVLGATCLLCSRSAEANQFHEEVIAKLSNLALNMRIHGQLRITFPRLSPAILTMALGGVPAAIASLGGAAENLGSNASKSSGSQR